MALLHLCLATRKKTGMVLHVAHIDHNIRPDSCRDAQFVDEFCQKKEVPCFIEHIPPRQWSGKAGTHEMAARKERYRLLARIAKKHSISFVFTAHQRDDQVETVLMRLLDRGTGLHGLAGIPERVERTGLQYLRPLLVFSRNQLEDFMIGREWREDPTNGDHDIRRNHFRREVLPYLTAQVSPDVSRHIAQLSETAAHYSVVLTRALEHFWATHRVGNGPTRYRIPREEIARYPDAFWHAAIAHLARQVREYSFGTRALDDIVALLKKKGRARGAYGGFLFNSNKESMIIECCVDSSSSF